MFPVLHGLYGEDGTVQGILELAQIPYVGCGVLASAVSMDKLSTKLIVKNLGIRQAEYVPVMKEELEQMDQVVKRVEDAFPYPVFIKPSNAGSSRGVSRADDRKSLENGLKEAALHDRRILVEEMIVGHEVECAVFGGGKEEVRASGVGEILAAADFYDFDAKYYNSDSRTVVDPELPGNAAEEIRESAVRIFKAVDGYGLSRVDFFVKEDGRWSSMRSIPCPASRPSVCTPCSGRPEAWEKRNWWTIFWNMRSGATKGRRLLWIRTHPSGSLIPAWEAHGGQRGDAPASGREDRLFRGYGPPSLRDKIQDTVIRFSEQIMRFLRSKGVKAIVIACNTASSYALDALRRSEDIPIIGVINAGARAAVSATKNGGSE